MNDIHKNDLIRAIARRTKLTQIDVRLVLEEFADELAARLNDGDKVVWTGVGTFEMRERQSRNGINPKTQEPMIVPATRVPGWTASQAFKVRVTGQETPYWRATHAAD